MAFPHKGGRQLEGGLCGWIAVPDILIRRIIR